MKNRLPGIIGPSPSAALDKKLYSFVNIVNVLYGFVKCRDKFVKIRKANFAYTDKSIPRHTSHLRLNLPEKFYSVGYVAAVGMSFVYTAD